MKTFRILGLALFTILVCLSACSGGGDTPIEPTPKPEVVKSEITIDSSITSNGVSFSDAGGEQSITFTTNESWTLSVASTTNGAVWCTASTTSGAKGSASVKFTVAENTSYDNRSVSVTIKAGTATKTFTISQKGVDALLVTTDKYEVAQEGGSISIEVKANIDYKMEISEDAKDWIKESSNRALTTYRHTLNISANEELEKREGEIIFKSGDKVETVKVYQAGGAILLLSQNEYNVNDKGDTISVDIKSNFEFGVQVPDVDWIVDEASSRGLSSHTLKYVIKANEEYDGRSASIVFYDKNSDLKDTLKVIQAQKDAIILSQKDIVVGSEGETIEVKLSSNVDLKIVMPSVDWITHVGSRTLKEHTLSFKVTENTSEDNRSAEIAIKDKNSDLREVIVVEQLGVVKAGYADSVVTIATAGTMKKLLGDDYLNITSLKVVGSINGDDVLCLRQMLGASEFNDAEKGKLTELDMSETIILEGGGWYYEDSTSIRYYTSNDVIGDYMFYSCGILQRIILPDGVTSIGEWGFYDCSSLMSINISNSIFSIGKRAFAGCSSLTSVYITDLSAWCNIEFEDHDSNPFCSAWGRFYLNNKELTELLIPIDIKEIKDYTFNSCNYLTKVIIPDGVTSIGNSAFAGCTYITSITLPDGLKSIGDYAFNDCNSLHSIEIPDGVTTIGWGAFAECTSFTTINIPASVTSIAPATFNYCKNLSSVTMGDGVTIVGGSAFMDCPSLSAINIPASVTSIGGRAFAGCKSLTSIVIPDGVTSINDESFDGCSSLTSINIPENVTSIGWGAFDGCSSLTSIDIPDAVISIENWAFHNCSSLTSVTIGKGVKSIKEGAFYNCSSLACVNIPDVVTTIGSSAFSNCDSLESVTVGNGVTSIGSYAFFVCSSLKSVSIGNGVTSIKEAAFAGCSSLTSVYITDLSAWCNIEFVFRSPKQPKTTRNNQT